MSDPPDQFDVYAAARRLLEAVPSHLLFTRTSKALAWWTAHLDRTWAIALVVFAEKHGRDWPIDLEQELAANPDPTTWGLPATIWD